MTSLPDKIGHLCFSLGLIGPDLQPRIVEVSSFPYYHVDQLIPVHPFVEEIRDPVDLQEFIVWARIQWAAADQNPVVVKVVQSQVGYGPIVAWGLNVHIVTVDQ